MWYKKAQDHVIFYIKAQPNASKNKVVGILGDELKIAIKAPAVEGAANKELVKFLSKLFKVPRSAVEFVGGQTSRKKAIKLPLNEKVETFIKEIDEG